MENTASLLSYRSTKNTPKAAIAIFVTWMFSSMSLLVVAQQQWAFEERFDGELFNPEAPTQTVLPKSMDYVVTHRTHPRDHLSFDSFPADHGLDCAGPPNQHDVLTSHLSNGEHPDESFFVCKEHMMSSMGHVSGYSVTTFYPKQEFDFSDGGVLEFDVNINGDHGARSWWEILITPRDQMKVGAAQDWLPIDETYPQDRIVLTFIQTKRKIQVGTGAIPPEGWVLNAKDWRPWAHVNEDDPALTDRRIRRTHRIVLESNRISWLIEKHDGTMDEYSAELPGGLPFKRGLVLFKTHAYTPEKDGNFNIYTFHWDNIRFSGPVVGGFETFETTELGYLQANGSRPIGDSTTMTIDVPYVGPNPVLFGQVHNPLTGQVVLNINKGSDIVVHPFDYENRDCTSNGWKSFRLELDPSWLKTGENTFDWTVGPRPACTAEWEWNGFSIKNLEVQFDLDTADNPSPEPNPDQDGNSNHNLPTNWPNSVQLGMMSSPGNAHEMKQIADFGFRYQYLAGGVNTGNGWANWNQDGNFVTFYIQDSMDHNINPVFTYYMIFQSNPGGGTESEAVATNLQNVETMTAYYQDLKLFFQKAAAFPDTLITLHVEPDMWGYIEQQSSDDPAVFPVAVASTVHQELSGLPNNAVGLAKAIIRLRDQLAPHVVLGYHLSKWGTGVDYVFSNPEDSQIVDLGNQAANFYRALDADFDLIFGEFRDRDAGFYEHIYGNPHAWMDEGDYARDILFWSTIHSNLTKPIVLWQVPYGNTKMKAMNNTWRHYQDNIVESLLDDPAQRKLRDYLDSGLIAVFFGQGASGTTCPCDAMGDGTTNPDPINGNDQNSINADDDGGFFRLKAAEYYSHGPLLLSHASTPEAPSNLSGVVVSSSSIQLQWTDNSNNEVRFRIERKEGTGPFGEVATVDANVTAYEDTGLQANTTYSYRVQAENGASASAYSNTVSKTTENEITMFPVVLQGRNLPEETSVNLEVSRPSDASISTLTLTVFDADIADEGLLEINGNGPVQLFGDRAAFRNDRITSAITLNIPADWWNDGTNTLRFMHTRTGGYRIDNATVDFGPADSDLPIILQGKDLPEEALFTLDINKPSAAGGTATLILEVFDADTPDEGEVEINDNGSVQLFGDQANWKNDRKTLPITFPTPAEWWNDGANSLRFIHNRTGGYRVENASVEFGIELASSTPSREFIKTNGPTKPFSKSTRRIANRNGVSPRGSMIAISRSVYEDAEDGKTTGWYIYNGGTVLNIEGGANGSARAIQTVGNIESDVFRLTTEDDGYDWNNRHEFVAEFSVAFEEAGSGAIYFEVATSNGIKYLVYTVGSATGSKDPQTICFDLGNIAGGQWVTIRRDLRKDLTAAIPNTKFTKVKGLFVYGSLKIDEVKLLNHK